MAHSWQEPLEKQITGRIMKYLKTLKGLSWKQHGSAFQSGLPDIFYLEYNEQKGCCEVFCFEVKRQGKKATAIQKVMHDDLRAQGCRVFVVHNKEEVQQVLENFWRI